MNNATAYTVHQLTNGNWTAIFYVVATPGTFQVGQILARSPREHADRSDAVQDVINACRLGVKDPRTMRKAPKWAAFAG